MEKVEKTVTVTHLKPYHGWQIDKTVESTRWSSRTTYWVYAPDSEDCQSVEYSMESAKSFIRQHDYRCTYHLYWVSYETGSKRHPELVVVSALSATDAVEAVKAPYNRGEKVPYPFSAKAHRVPNGMTEQEAKELAKQFKYTWQRGKSPWGGR